MSRGSFIRPDGVGKVTGQAQYAADLSLPGMLEGRLLLAGQAHALVRSIDTDEARSLPGVFAVITQADVPVLRYGNAVKDRTLFAGEVVRFEGEIVAAVAARTPDLADSALRLIKVAYEPLAPTIDAEVALEADAPLVHPNWAEYSALDGISRNGNDCSLVTIVKGDATQGFAEADAVIEERYSCDQSHPVPIEPHVVVAQWQGDRVTIWSTSQVPYIARAGVAEVLQMPEAKVRIVVPTLGGGFGGKCEFHFEAHAAALARKAGRPVRIVLSRHEEFIAPDKVNHPMVIELKTGIRNDGAITARSARIVMDTGAYASDAPSVAEIATMMAVGPYRIPNLDIKAHTVYTNKTPAGSVRAPSGPQVAWAVEQHTDELAKRIGMRPYEFRMRNLLEDGDTGPTGQRMAAVGMKACLAKAAEMIGASRSEDGEGVGLSCAWWFSLPGASDAYLKLNTDGTFTLVTGAQENGSGAVMGLAALAADQLGVDPDSVSILFQDTDAGAWDMGSAGSQTTYNNGRAVVAAARDLNQAIRDFASNMLEASADDLEIRDGLVMVLGAETRNASVAAVASAAIGAGRTLTSHSAPVAPPLPENNGSSCVGRVIFPAFADPTFACQAARVHVDAETGVVRVKQIAAAHDFGRVLNPTGALGQVEGGIVHSTGIALTEGTSYRDGRQLNPHLLDYKLLTASDAPEITVAFVETQSAGGPFGAKGVGEPPIIPAAGAIANAIADASGARVRQLPMTPPRMWRALHK